jgi:DNA-binding SARP family transcriptional activator
VTVGILGPLEVRVGGVPVAVAGSRLRILLARLAVDPGRVVTVSQLVEAVWDGEPPPGVSNALQALVSRLRRVLPDLVESQVSGYRLALGPDAVDAVRFESLAHRGREELRTDPKAAAVTLREALALWRGPALADIQDATFAMAAAARLDELRMSALEDKAGADLACGGTGTLVAELEELVALHPLRERLTGQLIRALAAAGRQADALASYERLRDRLNDELGIDPSHQLQAIHLDVLRNESVPAGERHDRARRASTTGPPPAPARTNLRAQISSFVGRQDDIARITHALAGDRLVTLVGPGGSGKTRLAVEAASLMLGAAPGGCWMAELAPLGDASEVPQAVLSLLGAREAGLLQPSAGGAVGAAAATSADRVIEVIGNRHILLIMENCEHLVAGVAALVDRMLGSCPALRVLATSREPLGITGEILHSVQSLATPGSGAAAADSLAYPAVRLFADRAAAVRPGFTVDDTNVADVVTICHELARHPHLPYDIGHDPPGQRRGTRDRKAAEPVVHTLADVGVQRHGRVQRQEQCALRDDPGQAELEVGGRRAGHRAAEHVGKQQHEHQRLQAEVHQLHRAVPDLDQVSPRDGEDVPERDGR